MKRVPPPVTPLSDAEQRLIRAYRAMNDEGQQAAVPIVEAWAVSLPRCDRPALRLVPATAPPAMAQ
ncbi:hypothetical protein HUX88_28990 [Duganella sp. BJB1802]|nr:hypothetical protein [Duganella sp. BJB1802]